MHPGSACACRRLLLHCTVPLHWQTGDWNTDLLCYFASLGPWLPGSLSNERPAALDPDRATGPWVSLISPESPLVLGGRVFPRRETSDSHHDETHAQAKPSQAKPSPRPCLSPEPSPQASPMLIADLFPLQACTPATPNPHKREALSAVELRSFIRSFVHSPGQDTRQVLYCVRGHWA
jgi:hypothetical protein